MSSEESEEDNSDTTTTQCIGVRRPSRARRVRQLLWESNEVKQIKRELDANHAQWIGGCRLSQMVVVSRPAGLFSTRRKPAGAMEWVTDQDSSTSLLTETITAFSNNAKPTTGSSSVVQPSNGSEIQQATDVLIKNAIDVVMSTVNMN